jgi:hypothetical protein
MAKPLPPAVNQDFLPVELKDIRKEIEGLPRSVRERLLPLCDRLCHFVHLHGRLFEIAQETVERLQLDMKYLVFDLDCTRRERDNARQELEHYQQGEGW